MPLYCDRGNDYALPGFRCSVLNILNKMASIQLKTESGAQSDMNTLEVKLTALCSPVQHYASSLQVGNGGQTDDECRTHFSMWALNAYPLIIGTDIRTLTPASLSMYSNPAVITLNQDPAVSAAVRHWRYYVPDVDENGVGKISTGARSLSNSDVAVVLVNTGNSTREMNETLAEVLVDNAQRDRRRR